MKMIKPFLIVPLIASLLALTQAKDLVDYANPLQGTDSKRELSRGNTYPAIALPWGMNVWTPQTGTNDDRWIYKFKSNEIRGFRQTHECSPWTGDYSAFSIMPVASALTVDQNKRLARFSHENELAGPHYYKVAFDNKMVGEMSPTERGAFMRFTFPKNEESFVVVDAGNFVYEGDSMIEIFPKEQKIVGYTRNAPHSVPRKFANYFVIHFNKPFRGYGTWEKNDEGIAANETKREGRNIGAYVQFRKGDKVEVKVASSFISIEQAEQNFKHELYGLKSLEQAKANAAKIWNEHLGKIVVEGGTEEQKATFYSCFYRSMLFPRKFFEYDADNKPVYYSPYDGKVYSGYMYTDTGFWDTFRAQFPLNVILHPKMHGEYMKTIMDAYDQSGWLPSWSFPGHSGGMIGNHAFSVLADAYAKGIRTFDPDKALAAMWHDANAKGPRGPSIGRDAAKDYWELGYIPFGERGEPTAKTLEYAYDDWCGMTLAKMVGNKEYEEKFSKAIFNYRNVYDPSVGFMRGRLRNGDWAPDFDPTEWGGAFIEGAAWHYVWSVFHDIQGLANLMGSDKALADKLDECMDTPGTFKVGTYGHVIHEMAELEMIKMGQYGHGNEEQHHMLYMYNYVGQPWKAQKWLRIAMDKLYNSGPDGYCGDEDQGQMASWYVISAMGLYSVTPGTDQYVIGSPLFPKMTISLENGKKLVIEAVGNNEQNVYIQSASLNGKTFSRNWLTYDEIMSGGTLRFNMSSQPEMKRGTAAEDRPYSVSMPKPD